MFNYLIAAARFYVWHWHWQESSNFFHLLQNQLAIYLKIILDFGLTSKEHAEKSIKSVPVEGANLFSCFMVVIHDQVQTWLYCGHFRRIGILKIRRPAFWLHWILTNHPLSLMCKNNECSRIFRTISVLIIPKFWHEGPFSLSEHGKTFLLLKKIINLPFQHVLPLKKQSSTVFQLHLRPPNPTLYPTYSHLILQLDKRFITRTGCRECC